MRHFYRFPLIVALLSPVAAWSHEFWLQSSSYVPAKQTTVELTAYVGEYFVGDRVGITASHAASVRVTSQAGTQDLASRIPSDKVLPGLSLTLATTGTQLVTYDSHPSQVVLSADKFHAYLHDEGMDWVIKLRDANGTAALPGRERFRRNAKMLLRVGGNVDALATNVVGQRLEIVPLADPLRAKPQDTARFAVRFEGKALEGVLVKAWHKTQGQTTVLRSTSDAQGQVALRLPFAGVWLLNTVHMVQVVDVPDIDWDSFWSSLTFEVRANELAR